MVAAVSVDFGDCVIIFCVHDLALRTNQAKTAILTITAVV